MHRTGGVTQSALRVFASFFGGPHGGFEVTHIVECIEYAKYIHAIIRRFLHEGFDHVIGIVAVTQQVLPAQ